MYKKAIAGLLLILLPSFVSAQLKSHEKGLDMRKVLKYGLNPIGLVSGSLLDSDKFNMSQSYRVSVGSFGGHSYSQAMYLNTMSYQISNPLSFKLQWGYLMNQPFGGNNKALGFNQGLPFNNGFFISGAQIKYQPSENTELKLEFRQVPSRYYYGIPYYDDR